MWQCEVCEHLNKDESEVSEQYGALRDESVYEDIYDEYLDKEEGLL